MSLRSSAARGLATRPRDCRVCSIRSTRRTRIPRRARYRLRRMPPPTRRGSCLRIWVTEHSRAAGSNARLQGDGGRDQAQRRERRGAGRCRLCQLCAERRNPADSSGDVRLQRRAGRRLRVARSRRSRAVAAADEGVAHGDCRTADNARGGPTAPWPSHSMAGARGRRHARRAGERARAVPRAAPALRAVRRARARARARAPRPPRAPAPAPPPPPPAAPPPPRRRRPRRRRPRRRARRRRRRRPRPPRPRARARRRRPRPRAPRPPLPPRRARRAAPAAPRPRLCVCVCVCVCVCWLLHSRPVFVWIVRQLRLAEFIVGESYGGFRAPRLAKALTTEHGVGVNGLILISPVLDFTMMESPTDSSRWRFACRPMPRRRAKAPAL